MQINRDRLFVREFAYAHDGETQHIAGIIHSGHDGIVIGFHHVARRVRKSYFEEITLAIEPKIYVLVQFYCGT